MKNTINNQCSFDNILVGPHAKFIKDLFVKLGRNAPKGEVLGVIRNQLLCPNKCNFKFSWGYEYYCDNQDLLRIRINQQEHNVPQRYLKGVIMDESVKQKLLENDKVIKEINDYLWIESEKIGHDIGYDHAANEWLQKFAPDWMKANMSEEKAPKKKRRVKI